MTIVGVCDYGVRLDCKGAVKGKAIQRIVGKEVSSRKWEMSV